MALVGGLTHKNSVIFGSVFVPIFDSKNANLSLTAVIDALVNAFSILRIQISILALSKAGNSGFRVKAVTSLTWSRVTSLTASGSMVVTAVTAAVVEARRVSCTRARIASASMVAVGNVKVDVGVASEGLGDLAATLSRRRCCGVVLRPSVGVLTRRL